MSRSPRKGSQRRPDKPGRRFSIRQTLRDALRRRSGWVLLAVNLGVLVGVLRYDWSVFEIVFLYWAENVIIGVINVLRMLMASPLPIPKEVPRDEIPAPAKKILWIINIGAKLFMVPFFCVHYGIFTLVHGAFVFDLFEKEGSHGMDYWQSIPDFMTTALAMSLAALAISHLYSFFANYIGRGEWRTATVGEMMARPYGRIIVLHITIIFGGIAAQALGSPLGLLLVLVLLKTVTDLAMHEREREKLNDPVEPATKTDMEPGVEPTVQHESERRTP
ncbi:hypothetical protein F3N42_00045 [Marinihelvus fidelis]|uniref:Uncharacterized protein n=1 Tax=Marinihelvus fidelis TaxID=2613842 RepID=A0A5N0THD1_9GAMM|nr:DUF6498-containing protein [Marinihelvus fidelis]KAA9133981.1 hypothetical protein F3N42_00045 [Marinihelvus fidelis]